MTVRTWVYSQLTTFPGLIALIGNDNPRVYAKKTMTSSIEHHPYLVYKLGFKANEDLAESMPDDKDVARQFLQVWVHDFTDGDKADYMKIDEVLKQLKLALHLQSSPEDGIIFCKYIETSQDLNDDTLNTVFKYMRFQLTTKET